MDLTAADLLVVQAALTAGAGPAAALAEVPNPALRPLAATLRSGVSLPAVAASLQPPAGPARWVHRGVPPAVPDGAGLVLPPAASALVRALAVAEIVGSPAGPAVQAVLDAVRADIRLHGLIRIRSAQAITSARFLTGLPVLGGLVLALVDPAARRFLTGPIGLAVIVLAVLLIGVAALWMRHLLGAIAGAGSTADPLVASPSAARGRRILLVLAVAAVMAVATSLIGGTLAGGLTWAGASMVASRRVRPDPEGQAATAAPIVPDVAGGLPTVEALDLLALALAGGVGLAAACRLAGRLGPTPARAAMADVAARLDAGTQPAAAFPDQLAELATLIAITGRWGAPIAEALRLLAGDLRDRAATAAEEAAEQLSVRLVFPTTLLLVPAFGLLVVTPMVASGLGGFGAGP